MFVVHEFERCVSFEGPPSEIENVDEGGCIAEGVGRHGILVHCCVRRVVFFASDEVRKRGEESVGKDFEECQFVSSSIFSDLKFFRSFS